MKKILAILVTALLLTAAFTACDSYEPQTPTLESTAPDEVEETAPQDTAQSYTQLTQWNYHATYRFLPTSIVEQGDYLLLRGAVARDTLTPEELEVARDESAIEINGETFTHTAIDTEGLMANDRLYNALTGTEIFLVPAFFGEFEGEDIRFRMYDPSGQSVVYKKTELYMEVAVDSATPIEIWRPVTERMEWGYLELFAPMDASARMFSNSSEYEIPDGFPFDGVFDLTFDNGRCIHLRWNQF